MATAAVLRQEEDAIWRDVEGYLVPAWARLFALQVALWLGGKRGGCFAATTQLFDAAATKPEVMRHLLPADAPAGSRPTAGAVASLAAAVATLMARFEGGANSRNADGEPVVMTAMEASNFSFLVDGSVVNGHDISKLQRLLLVHLSKCITAPSAITWIELFLKQLRQAFDEDALRLQHLARTGGELEVASYGALVRFLHAAPVTSRRPPRSLAIASFCASLVRLELLPVDFISGSNFRTNGEVLLSHLLGAIGCNTLGEVEQAVRTAAMP